MQAALGYRQEQQEIRQQKQCPLERKTFLHTEFSNKLRHVPPTLQKANFLFPYNFMGVFLFLIRKSLKTYSSTGLALHVASFSFKINRSFLKMHLLHG